MRTLQTFAMLCSIFQRCHCGKNRRQLPVNLRAAFVHGGRQDHNRHWNSPTLPSMPLTLLHAKMPASAHAARSSLLLPRTLQREGNHHFSSIYLSLHRHSSSPTRISLAAASSIYGSSEGEPPSNKEEKQSTTMNGRHPKRRADDYDSMFFTPAEPEPVESGARRFPSSSSPLKQDDQDVYSNEDSFSDRVRESSAANSYAEGEYDGDGNKYNSGEGWDKKDSSPRPRATSSTNQRLQYEQNEQSQPFSNPIKQQQYTNLRTNQQEQTQQFQRQGERPSSAIESRRALFQFRPLPPGSSRRMPPTISDYDESDYSNIGGAPGDAEVYADMNDDQYDAVEGGYVTRTARIIPKIIESKSASDETAGSSLNYDDVNYTPLLSSVQTSTSRAATSVPPSTNKKNFFDSDVDLPLNQDAKDTATPKAATAGAPSSRTTTNLNKKNFFDSDNDPPFNGDAKDATSSEQKFTPKAATSVTTLSLRSLPRVTPAFMEPVKTKAMVDSNDKNFFDSNDNNDFPREKLPTETSSGTSTTSYLTTLSLQLEHLTAQIYQLNSGVEFNINSPKQVASALFGEDNTGGSSTNKDVLEAMASAGNEMAACIFKFRKLTQEMKREKRRIEQQEKGDVKNDYFGNVARINARKKDAASTGGSATENDGASEQRTDVSGREPLLLIDISAYIFRAYHAIPPLHHSDGTPTGALHGVCRMLQNLLLTRLLKGERPRVVLAFDFKGPNFRHGIYPEYKANRGPCPEDLVPQFELVREAAHAFGVVQVEAEGYEADDVIATLARQAVEDGVDVDILSGDKDLMQLITPPGIEPSVHMIDPMHFDRVDHDDVVKKWGVPSEKLGDVLALAGDAADNIPGAPGIGPKIAATLIQEYGTLSNLIDQADKIKQKKRRESLIENAKKVQLFREVVTLDESIPVSKMTSSSSLQAMGTLRMSSFDPNRLIDFYKRMELNSCQNQLQTRLRSSWVNYKPPPSPEEYESVPF